ncbi:MAG TPA: cation transporter [Eubacteriaceae bacterium]|nr:cation transporter [Eubacteriaceae bacterium]
MDKDNHRHEKKGNIKVAFILNLFFTILEIIGGLWTNSTAILSDALHDLGDSISLGLAWYFEGYSKKEPDEYFSFGYSRFSLLGALINSIVLIIGSVFVLMRAVPRIFKPEEVNAEGMLVFAIMGIVINGLAVIRLRKGNSLNEKVVSWHLLEDVLGWAAVLVVSVVLLFVDLPILDPILSMLITFYVLFNVTKNIKEIMRILLQGVPNDFSIAEIQKDINNVDGILSVYHTHIWSLEGKKNLLTTHIIVDDETGNKNIIAIKNSVRNLAKQNGIEHVTIEVDFKSEGMNKSNH